MWPSIWSRTVSQARILHFHFNGLSLHHRFPDFDSLDIHEPDLDSASPRPSSRRASICLLPLAHTGIIRLLGSRVAGSILPVAELDISYGAELSSRSRFPCSSLLADGSQI